MLNNLNIMGIINRNAKSRYCWSLKSVELKIAFSLSINPPNAFLQLISLCCFKSRQIAPNESKSYAKNGKDQHLRSFQEMFSPTGRQLEAWIYLVEVESAANFTRFCFKCINTLKWSMVRPYQECYCSLEIDKGTRICSIYIDIRVIWSPGFI